MNNYTPKQLKKQLIEKEETIKELRTINRFIVEQAEKYKTRIIDLRIENNRLKETIEELQK